ncbi:MAG: hypothetical protein U5Q16_04165 [Gammaproteobacteria bacterium]|nr:hypothetical protein [Gammaproteobacteria bacterium]
MAYLQRHQYAAIEAQPEAEESWVDHVNDVAGLSIYPRCTLPC